MQHIEEKQKIDEKGDLALLKDLERREDGKTAQRILDALKEVENPDRPAFTAATFNYRMTKCFSEGSEIYFNESQAALKLWKGCKPNHQASEGVVDWEASVYEREFKKLYGFYKRFDRAHKAIYSEVIQDHNDVNENPIVREEKLLNEVVQNIIRKNV